MIKNRKSVLKKRLSNNKSVTSERACPVLFSQPLSDNFSGEHHTVWPVEQPDQAYIGNIPLSHFSSSAFQMGRDKCEKALNGCMGHYRH